MARPGLRSESTRRNSASIRNRSYMPPRYRWGTPCAISFSQPARAACWPVCQPANASKARAQQPLAFQAAAACWGQGHREGTRPTAAAAPGSVADRVRQPARPPRDAGAWPTPPCYAGPCPRDRTIRSPGALRLPCAVPAPVEPDPGAVTLVRVGARPQAGQLPRRPPVRAWLTVPWSQIAAATADLTEDCGYIFHIGHVGSTLLSRLMGAPPGPGAARATGPAHPGQDVESAGLEPVAARLPILIKLLSRHFAPEQIPW